MLRLLILSLLTACGYDDPARALGTAALDPDLQSLILEFGIDAGHPVISPVSFGDKRVFVQLGMADDTVGVCIPGEFGLNSVILLRSYWDAAPEDARWALVFHELGHCELGRDHRDMIAPDGCPVSVMRFELATTVSCLENGKRSRHDYERELFDP